MKIETQEIYKCEHCNKLYQIKGYCEKHEISCPKNPDNFRKCFGCKFLKKEKTEYFFDTVNGSDSRMINIFHCSKIDSFLYPPKVEHKQNYYELGDELNQPMRKECDQFVDEYEEIFDGVQGFFRDR